MKPISMEEINQAIAIKDRIIKNSLKDKSYGHNLEFYEMIKHFMFLSPSSYGKRLENYFKEKLFNGVNIPQSYGIGDVITDTNLILEIKCSIITSSNNSLNLVQIRPWENNHGGVFFAIDTRNVSFCNVYIFSLNKEQLLSECANIASAAHGTTEINGKNEKIELRLSIPIDPNNKDFKRWCTLYLDHGLKIKMETVLKTNDLNKNVTINPYIKPNKDEIVQCSFLDLLENQINNLNDSIEKLKTKNITSAHLENKKNQLELKWFDLAEAVEIN